MAKVTPILALLFVFFFITLHTVQAKLREGECEVCMKAVEDFRSKINKLSIKNEDAMHNAIKDVCKTYTEPIEKRFCYFIGGSADAATSLLRTISQPIQNSVPTEKICEKLKKADDEICRLRYPKEEIVDWSTVNFEKMRVKELRETLKKWGHKCVDCVEKSEFLRLINEKLPEAIKQQNQKLAASSARSKSKTQDL